MLKFKQITIDDDLSDLPEDRKIIIEWDDGVTTDYLGNNAKLDELLEKGKEDIKAIYAIFKI